MEARDAYRRMLASMRRTTELHEHGGRDSRVMRLDGVTAAITPAAPERSVASCVVVEDFSKLEAALPELARPLETRPGCSRGAWGSCRRTRASSTSPASTGGRPRSC